MVTSTTTTTAADTKNNTGIPKWTLSGDWFDVCKCNIPCPCEFAYSKKGPFIILLKVISLEVMI
jgi:hypothetical protein